MGSHVLDSLRKRGIDVAVLVRSTSSSGLFSHHLKDLDVRRGAIADPASLEPALHGITHVIHCAGATKAATIQGFYEVNQHGTRNMVQAANGSGTVERFLLVSSLAASGPGTPEQPVREDSSPNPVTPYGKSKLLGEAEVQQHCRSQYVIVRPPAVYGPRDDGFLPLFKSVKKRLVPRPAARQSLSLVYVEDLAEAIVYCLSQQHAAGQTYFAAHTQVTSARQMADTIARQFGKSCVPLPLPNALLWATCMLHELRTQMTGKPHILSRHKYAEIEAPGWVCTPAKLEAAGFTCQTDLQEGIRKTWEWYEEAQWL